MGSLISLGVGEFELAWGKNDLFENYSQLFLPSDKKDIPYYYADNVIEHRPGYSRKLKDVKVRLDLLGYSMAALPRLYQDHLYHLPSGFNHIDISFDKLSSILSEIKIQEYRNKFENADYDPGEYALENVFRHEVFKELYDHIDSDSADDVGLFFENIDPLLVLRLLMENSANEELVLEWRTSDVVDGGWIAEDDLYTGIGDSEKFLIITEGSSDSFIIKRSLELLKPEIIDFFSFIDMEENYPFTGTGNLFKFCQGLATIKILNKALIIFDNDSEGVDKFEKASALTLPPSLKIMKLPSLSEFTSFHTIGPSGDQIENVNGRAVAIECFLDLTFDSSRSPRIRWTNYNTGTKTYQGSLENKDDFIRRFKNVNNKGTGYNLSKLEKLVQCIVDTCANP